MGAWDHTTFGNDDACDWGGDLRSCEDLSLVEETLDTVIDSKDEYLEAPESSQAIAAAEVVARLQGRFGVRNAYTESVDEWVAAHPLTVPTALAQKAHAALDRILVRPSELLELWEESDDFEAWKGTITELKSRIQA
jgi:septation ring formation regulator EzrA